MKRVAFLTCDGLPDLSGDDALAAPAFAARGATIEPVPWDRPATLEAFDGLVVRSCWNYHLKLDAFRAFVGDVARRGLRLVNPPAMVLANLDKQYLRSLAAEGVAIPRTVWLPAGTRADLADLMRAEGLAQAVVKPTVSLSAYKTWRTSIAEAPALQPQLDDLLAATGVMVQELVGEVVTGGEQSLVFFDGAFSHAVLKRPRPGDFRVQEEHGGSRDPLTPTPDILRQAAEIVARMSPPPTYARVDGVDVRGRFVLMELELVDPMLYLIHGPEAAERFAAAVLAALGR